MARPLRGWLLSVGSPNQVVGRAGGTSGLVQVFEYLEPSSLRRLPVSFLVHGTNLVTSTPTPPGLAVKMIQKSLVHYVRTLG